MKKGFTLLEFLVVGVITTIIFSLVIAIASNSSMDLPEDEDGWWVSPEIQNMHSQKKIADELKRQNDLRERELELYKQPEKE